LTDATKLVDSYNAAEFHVATAHHLSTGYRR